MVYRKDPVFMNLEAKFLKMNIKLARAVKLERSGGQFAE